jgi:divalent metal cation (Fe/Co/Zn/Cd) transporter
MDANESRLVVAISACVLAFLIGIVGFAVASDQVKDRVDRRVAQQVDRRICQLMPAACPPPSAATTSRRGD